MTAAQAKIWEERSAPVGGAAFSSSWVCGASFPLSLFVVLPSPLLLWAGAALSLASTLVGGAADAPLLLDVADFPSSMEGSCFFFLDKSIGSSRLMWFSVGM